MPEESKDNRVHVSVRVRPPNNRELADPEYVQAVDMNCDEKWISVKKEMGDKRTFHFDHTFDQRHSSDDVWNLSCKAIVQDVVNGFNGCIMVYGQTGSGKSFTMSNIDMNNRGVIFRAMDEIFEAKSADATHEYSIELSYIQIYCEMIQDLLNPGGNNLPIREKEDGSVYVQNVTIKQVQNVEECIALFDEGNSNRSVANTMMNAVSSRSHACLTIYVTKGKKMTEEDYKKAEAGDTNSNAKTCGATHGKLVLVDLAGSERMKKCFAPGTQIKMFDGTVKAVEDVKEGDNVLGDDFRPRIVSECISGSDQMYKVNVVVEGESAEGYKEPLGFVCNEGHPLVVRLPAPRIVKEDKRGSDVWTVEYMMPAITSLTKVRRTFETEEEAGLYFSSLDDMFEIEEEKNDDDSDADVDGDGSEKKFESPGSSHGHFIPPFPSACYQILLVENIQALDPDVQADLRLIQREEIDGVYCERSLKFSVERLPGLGQYYGFSLDQNRKFCLGDGTVVHNTGATDMRATEGKAINLSLTALGNVIHALSDPEKFKHVPYRDSKLTRLLSDSIGGNSKTSLVICASPAEMNANETINSLAFGDRAMKVAQKAKANIEVDYKTLARKLQARLDKIDEEIAQAQAALLKEQKLRRKAIEQRDKAIKRADDAEAKLRMLVESNSLDFDVDKELGPRELLDEPIGVMTPGEEESFDPSMNESFAVPSPAPEMIAGADRPDSEGRSGKPPMSSVSVVEPSAVTPGQRATRPPLANSSMATTPNTSHVSDVTQRQQHPRPPPLNIPSQGRAETVNIKKGEVMPLELLFGEAKKLGTRSGDEAATAAEALPVKLAILAPSTTSNLEKCSLELEKHRKQLQTAKQREAGLIARMKAQHDAEQEFLRAAVTNNELTHVRREEGLRNDVLELNQVLEEKEAMLTSLKETLEVAEGQLESLERSSTDRMIEMTSQLAQAKEEARDSRSQITELEEIIDRHEDEIAALKDEVHNISETCSDLEMERDSISSSLDTTSNMLAEKEREVERLNDELEAANAEKADIAERLDTTEMELGDLAQQLSAVKEELALTLETSNTLQQKVEELEDANAETVAELESIARELESESLLREESQIKLSELQNAFAGASAAAASGESTVTELSINLAHAETKRNDLANAVAAATMKSVVESVVREEQVKRLVSCLGGVLNVLKTVVCDTSASNTSSQPLSLSSPTISSQTTLTSSGVGIPTQMQLQSSPSSPQHPLAADDTSASGGKHRVLWSNAIHSLVSAALAASTTACSGGTVSAEDLRNTARNPLAKLAKVFAPATAFLSNGTAHLISPSIDIDNLGQLLTRGNPREFRKAEKLSVQEILTPISDLVNSFDFPKCGSAAEEATTGKPRWNRLDETYAKRIMDNINSMAGSTAGDILAKTGVVVQEETVLASLTDFIESTKNIVEMSGVVSPAMLVGRAECLESVGELGKSRVADAKKMVGKTFEVVAKGIGALLRHYKTLSKAEQSMKTTCENVESLKSISKEITGISNCTSSFITFIENNTTALDEAHVLLCCSIGVILRMAKTIRFQNAQALDKTTQLNQTLEALVAKMSQTKLFQDEINTLRQCFQQNIEQQKAEAQRRKMQKREKRKREKAAMTIQRFIRNIWNENTLKRFEDRLNKVQERNVQIEKEKQQLEVLQVETGELILRQGVTQIEQLAKQLLDFFTEPKSIRAGNIKKERVHSSKSRKKNGDGIPDGVIYSPSANDIVAPRFESLTPGDNPMFMNPLFKK